MDKKTAIPRWTAAPLQPSGTLAGQVVLLVIIVVVIVLTYNAPRSFFVDGTQSISGFLMVKMRPSSASSN